VNKKKINTTGRSRDLSDHKPRKSPFRAVRLQVLMSVPVISLKITNCSERKLDHFWPRLVSVQYKLAYGKKVFIH